MTTPSQKRVPLPETERQAPHNATDTGKTSPQQIISVSVIVRRKNHLDLEALGGRTISRQEFNEKYAADPADFDALRKFAHDHGLSVDEGASSLARRTMVLRGTAQALEAAFGVDLHDYEREGHKFHAFQGGISVPAEHLGIIESVLGLDTRPIATPHLRFRDKKKKPKAADPSYNPMQVAALYDFPSGVNGSGQTIGIIELGGGYNASDLQTYFSGLGLTPPTVVAVSVDGAANAPTNPNSADGEVALDIEVAAAVAPGAKIAVYFTTNTAQGFLDAITTAVHDTANAPTVISISWGGPESGWTKSSMNSIDNACKSAGALGITITVASGDNGSSDGVSGGGNNVDFPASSPHVLACGGTKLEGSGTTIQSEVVWNDGVDGGATGGGVSTYFALPTWQNNANVPKPSGTTGGRGVPDVSGDASPTTGYNILVDGSSEVVGGTSAVAPLWAALIALTNQQIGKPVGFVNPTLYATSSAFHDITQGNNGSFSAGPGWDACTGMGSPIGVAVAQALSGAASGTAKTSGSSHAGSGQEHQRTA
ncbi:MAG TPA: S53 family peptidase [Silvibacterium sp.]|jgi:kumamolisin|nr:S53 family peptidase [Silvibacterium sp.]